MSEGIPITDPVELAWCVFARHRAERGLPVEMRDQAVSIASFGAGAAWERSRIRRELLEAIEEEAWTYVPSRGERLSVLSATAMKERLDRIIPEER